jgi:predicted phage replisome organizer
MAGKQNNNGVFMMNDKIAYTDEMLSTIFRRPLNIVRLALNTFEQFGMIEIVNNAITIPNWEKHQSLDKLEKAKEKNRKRVAAHRERQKQLASNCNDYSNDTVIDCNDTDKNRLDKNRLEEEENRTEEKKKKSASRFIPPTVEQVKEYCIERNNNVDPERFVDYYTSNGWIVGKNKMKDWKAAVRTWEKRNFSNNTDNNKQSEPKLDFSKWQV